MRKKARGGAWQGRAGSEGSSWVDAGRPPLSRQERDPGGAGPGKRRNGGRKAGGTEGEGIRSPALGAGFFRALSPHQGVRQNSRHRLHCSSAGRAYPPMRKVCRGGARNGGSRDRGIEAFVQSEAGSESGRSRSLLRLVGPLPAQDLFRAGRPPVATTIDRPSLRSCPRLFVWSPHHHGGSAPERGRRGRKKKRARQSFFFPRPLSLLSLMASPRESCFLPAVSAVILSKNPVQ